MKPHKQHSHLKFLVCENDLKIQKSALRVGEGNAHTNLNPAFSLKSASDECTFCPQVRQDWCPAKPSVLL